MNQRWALGVLLFLTSCTSGERAGKESGSADSPSVERVPAALQAAHAAYLDGDWMGVGERVRDVLLDTTAGELARDNALELLDRAYESQRGRLPSAFTLPDRFVGLTYGHNSGMSPNGPYYGAFVRCRMRGVADITGLTVRRLPDSIVLDMESGKGKADIRQEEEGVEDLVLEDRTLKRLPADGVFSIRLRLADGTVSEGWFLVHGLASSAVPDLLSPQPSASSFTGPHPAIRWVPFRSPLYRTFEPRNVGVYVSKAGAKDPGFAWGFWTGEPGELGEVLVGAQAGAPTTDLEPGDYWVVVIAGEVRYFGPVRLVRGAARGAPFHVLR